MFGSVDEKVRLCQTKLRNSAWLRLDSLHTAHSYSATEGVNSESTSRLDSSRNRQGRVLDLDLLPSWSRLLDRIGVRCLVDDMVVRNDQRQDIFLRNYDGRSRQKRWS